MKEFFAGLFEWFGLFHLYSRDLGEFLRGWDSDCTGYFSMPWYLLIGWGMIILTTLIFGLQYDLISSSRFKKGEHWELAAVLVVLSNFSIAFVVPGVAVRWERYCPQLQLSFSDCFFFGLSVAVWAFILFSLLSGLQILSDRLAKK